MTVRHSSVSTSNTRTCVKHHRLHANVKYQSDKPNQACRLADDLALLLVADLAASMTVRHVMKGRAQLGAHRAAGDRVQPRACDLDQLHRHALVFQRLDAREALEVPHLHVCNHVAQLTP